MTVLDLTHPITPDMPVYPGDPQPRLTTLACMPRDGFRQLELKLTTHTGTHVDAPAHLLEHGAALDRYAPGRMRQRFCRLLTLPRRSARHLCSSAPDTALCGAGRNT